LQQVVSGGGRLRALFVVEQGCRAVDDPDVVLPVDRDAGDLTENPVFRQRLRPVRLGLELRHARLGDGVRRSRYGGDKGSRNGPQGTHHDSSPKRRQFRVERPAAYCQY